MSPLLASSDDLSLLTPIPLVLHPAAVYLDSLSESSQATIAIGFDL